MNSMMQTLQPEEAENRISGKSPFTTNTVCQSEAAGAKRGTTWQQMIGLPVFMFRVYMLLCAGMTIGLCTSAAAETPECEAGQLLIANGSPIDIGKLAGVTVADWNNDNKKDLIIGGFIELNSGKLRLYLNQGTDASPSFSDWSYLKVGSNDIQLWAGS